LRLPRAKTAETVIENHVLSRRSSRRKAIHSFHPCSMLDKGITLNLTTGYGLQEITLSEVNRICANVTRSLASKLH
jgi:hypothetical protein